MSAYPEDDIKEAVTLHPDMAGEADHYNFDEFDRVGEFDTIGDIIESGDDSSSDDSGLIVSKEQRQLIKMQTQVQKTLIKIDSIRIKRKNEYLHSDEVTQFQMLLTKIYDALQVEQGKTNAGFNNNNNNNNNISKATIKSLRNEHKAIKKLFNGNKKVWQLELKKEKFERKAAKQEQKKYKQKLKAERAALKYQRKQEKFAKKQEKLQRKANKKAEKDRKKELKQQFLQTLENARIEELPLKNLNNLELWIDGWNISGCFGGRSRSKGKLIGLLQNYYNASRQGNNGSGLIKNIELFYDGNGRNKLDGNVNITHSTKDMIVDDLWIQLLTNMNVERKLNIICVTSDRELTVRLHNVGVKVMKSGRFFKTYLKPLMDNNDNNGNGNNGNDNNDDIDMVGNDNLKNEQPNNGSNSDTVDIDMNGNSAQ